MKTSYDKNKDYIKTYHAKCARVQILLNPDNEEDKALIDFLDELGGPTHRAKTAKEALKRYMKMTAALKGLQ